VAWRTSIQRDDVVYGLACRRVKVVGKPYEGEPHVRFDVAGGGNQDVGPRRHSLTLPLLLKRFAQDRQHRQISFRPHVLLEFDECRKVEEIYG